MNLVRSASYFYFDVGNRLTDPPRQHLALGNKVPDRRNTMFGSDGSVKKKWPTETMTGIPERLIENFSNRLFGQSRLVEKPNRSYSLPTQLYQLTRAIPSRAWNFQPGSRQAVTIKTTEAESPATSFQIVWMVS